ncbi:MAG: hypothetical protein ACJ790_02305 [Myxococcaceae bacterium]
MNPNDDHSQKPRYGQPGKTPGSAEGDIDRRREVDPGKTPGKAEGEEFSDPGTSREHPDKPYDAPGTGR